MGDFHTVDPTQMPDGMRSTLRQSIFPSSRGAAQFRELTLDSPLIKKTFYTTLACSTAQTVGYSGGTSFSLLRDGVDFIGGKTDDQILDKSQTNYRYPLLTAQLAVLTTPTPPAQAYESLHTLPFTEIDDNGVVEQSASIKLIAQFAAVKGDTDSFYFQFNWYSLTARPWGVLFLEIWDLPINTKVESELLSGQYLPMFFKSV